MDSIYSRKRIKIPKIDGFYSKKNNKNAKKFFSIFIIITVASVTFYSIFKSINPIFDELCREKTRQIGVEIINKSADKVLENIDYNDIIKIEKNDNGNILKTDVASINKIASQISLEALEELKEMENENIQIPIGALTANKYLSGFGPKINVKLIQTGDITSQIKNEFEEKGINQTIYRIYLEFKCNISIATGYKTIDEEVSNQVLLVETVIVGNVPTSYYNLEGLDNKDSINLVE